MGKNKEENKSKNGKRSVAREILSWVEVFVIAGAIAFCVNNFIIANSVVPTASMENTIMTGDRVVGSRLKYTFGEPERGDIAIFKYAKECKNCHSWIEIPEGDICPACGYTMKGARTIHYVKRVIGVPGDVIDIVPDDPEAEVSPVKVYVNGECLREEYINGTMYYAGNTGEAELAYPLHYEVPENCYFLMGDNRNNSLDARYWQNHYVSKDRMEAKVLFKYWPKIQSLR